MDNNEVLLYCDGCEHTFSGSRGLVGALCGLGQVRLADVCAACGEPEGAHWEGGELHKFVAAL